MPRRIAIFGGSFNPPGRHHRRLCSALAREFDEVRVIPCGPRPDKEMTNGIAPIFRAALADLTFGGLPRVKVELFDLEQNSFTRNHELEERFRTDGEVWHVVGADLIQGGAKKRSAIQRTWAQGQKLWRSSRFAVITRPGHPISRSDLPPKHKIFELNEAGSSTDIRRRLSHAESVDSLLTPRALAYITRYGLYRTPIFNTTSHGSLAGEPYDLRFDPYNRKANQWSRQFRKHSSARRGRFFLILGGDGAMLRNIREHWRKRLPFFGINAGHLGFLMNRAGEVLDAPFPPADVVFRQLPMLYIECEDEKGRIHTTYAFNDAWVERSTSQSAWLEVTVNGVKRLPKLVSDGALVATAAGSTAYARSMGASPLLAETPGWLLVGSNVMEPADWKSALLSTDATVEVRNLDPKHRPIEAFVDGQSQGTVVSLKARISRAAAAELVFCASHDMAEKIAAIQFHGSGNTGLPPKF